MAEHDKAWFLKELIRLNAFATSASELAIALGYKGKTQIYRILDDKAGAGTIDEVWRRIRKVYDLSDDEVCEYINVIGTAKDLWKEVQVKAKAEPLELQSLADQTLHALLLRDEVGMRKVLNLPDWECLLDYSREHPMQYAQLIVIYYTLYNNIERAIKGKLSLVGNLILDGLYQHMHTLQPENVMLREMADAYRSELSQMNGNGNLWTIILRPTFLVQNFTDPNFRINTLSTLRLLPIPTDSLWMDMDTVNSRSGLAYIFFEVEPEGATGGRYDCIEVEATIDDHKLVVKRCFSFWMLEPELGEDCGIAFFQFRDECGKKQIVRYLYEYDGVRHNLHLEPVDADSPNRVSFSFPTNVHWIDEKQPIIEKESRWIAWYKDFMDANEEKVFIEMMKSEGVVMREEYEIIDVSISRRYLTVTLNDGIEEYDIRTELIDHPGLRLVVPDMDAAVFLHEDDQQLYLEWISPHISIPLNAFARI